MHPYEVWFGRIWFILHTVGLGIQGEMQDWMNLPLKVLLSLWRLFVILIGSQRSLEFGEIYLLDSFETNLLAVHHWQNQFSKTLLDSKDYV